VRWDTLFEDLSGQGAASDLAQHAVEVADRARLAAGRAGLADRLRGLPRPAALTVGLTRAQRLDGELLAVGADWLALLRHGQDCLVPLASIRWIQPVPLLGPGPGRAIGAVEAGPVRDRLGLTYAVRCLARDRAAVRVDLLDADSVTGTIDQAGLDHLQLARHAADEPRRASSVSPAWWIPFSAVTAIHGGQVWSDS
jgi:hypothetical protein